MAFVWFPDVSRGYGGVVLLDQSRQININMLKTVT